MKFVLFFVTMLAAVLAVFAFRSPIDRPRPGTPGFPTFPGQGPFNPRIPSGPWNKPIRFRREVEAEAVAAEEDASAPAVE